MPPSRILPEPSEPQKIRVLLAIGSLEGGGSERQVLGILKHLDRSRFEPYLYLIYRRGDLLAEVPDDVPIFAFWERHPSDGFYFPGRIHRMQTRDLCAVIREQRIDVVYERTYHMTLIAAAACRRAAVPRVSVIVTDPGPDLASGRERFLTLKRQLLKRGYSTADKTLAVSESLRSRACEFYGLLPSQVETLENFLDVDRIRRLSQQQTPEWDAERFHIVAAGRLHQQKGHLDLLRALERLVRRSRTEPAVHLLGRGPLEGELRQWVEKRGLAEHVHFEGFIDNPFPYFRRADLFCLPSLYEGMPNVLMEAMYCGTPIVAANCTTGPNEILAGGEFGTLVPPADPVALADAIEEAMTDRGGLRARAEAARVAAERRWSPGVLVPRLQDILTSVCR